VGLRKKYNYKGETRKRSVSVRSGKREWDDKRKNTATSARVRLEREAMVRKEGESSMPLKLGEYKGKRRKGRNIIAFPCPGNGAEAKALAT